LSSSPEPSIAFRALDGLLDSFGTFWAGAKPLAVRVAGPDAWIAPARDSFRPVPDMDTTFVAHGELAGALKLDAERLPPVAALAALVSGAATDIVLLCRPGDFLARRIAEADLFPSGKATASWMLVDRESEVFDRALDLLIACAPFPRWVLSDETRLVPRTLAANLLEPEKLPAVVELSQAARPLSFPTIAALAGGEALPDWFHLPDGEGEGAERPLGCEPIDAWPAPSKDILFRGCSTASLTDLERSLNYAYALLDR
jgi:hypothetical protein